MGLTGPFRLGVRVRPVAPRVMVGHLARSGWWGDGDPGWDASQGRGDALGGRPIVVRVLAQLDNQCAGDILDPAARSAAPIVQ